MRHCPSYIFAIIWKGLLWFIWQAWQF